MTTSETAAVPEAQVASGPSADRILGQRPSPEKRQRRGSALARSQRRLTLPYLSVALVLYTGLFIVPSLYSVYAAFTNWDGVNPPEWTGFNNFVRLFHDPVFLSSFANTLILTIGVGILVFVLSFAFLLVIREMRGGRFVRNVIFVPHIISSVALAIFWGFLWRYDGVVNAALNALHIPSVGWLGPDTEFALILAALVWMSTGYYVTILMAGVDAIPEYFYEAAVLDGTNSWQRFRHVTLPLSWDVVSVSAVLWTISSVKIFEFIYTFGQNQGNLPPVNVWTNALFVYGKTVGGNSPAYQFGYASASALVALLVVLILVGALRRSMRREPIEF